METKELIKALRLCATGECYQVEDTDGFPMCGCNDISGQAADVLESPTCVLLPCRPGDVCFEIDPGHGVVKHVVTGTTVYNRAADGVRYMTDFVNVITIDTFATDDHGGEWPDHYTPEEWEASPKTREAAEAQKAMDGAI